MNATTEEFREAARGVLATPFLDENSQAMLVRVRRHRGELATFFADELGYRLDASRPGVARLAKMPGAGHVARGLESRGGRRFDGRRHALTCLVLAAAEAAGERTTLARLFEAVGERAAAVASLDFDVDVAGDRRAFIHAVQVCVDFGVLEFAEGDEERFAKGQPGGDALYRVDREVLALLPTVSQPPSLVATPAQVSEEAYPDTDEGRARRRRHRVMRGLVEQPVVYREDLSDDEVDYLVRQRPRIERILSERLGLVLEVREEGWVAVDEEGDLTDVRFPDFGAANTAALRICDELGVRVRHGAPPVWPMPEITSFVQLLAEEYEGFWPAGAGERAEAERVTADAVRVLESMRLARRSTEEESGTVNAPAATIFESNVRHGIVALPAAGRFAMGDARPGPAVRSARRPVDAEGTNPPMMDFEAPAMRAEEEQSE